MAETLTTITDVEKFVCELLTQTAPKIEGGSRTEALATGLVNYLRYGFEENDISFNGQEAAEIRANCLALLESLKNNQEGEWVLPIIFSRDFINLTITADSEGELDVQADWQQINEDATHRKHLAA